MPDKIMTAQPHELLALYNFGFTLQRIAGVFGVSRERVRQVLSKMPEYKRRLKDKGPSKEEIAEIRLQESIASFWSRVDKSSGPDACWTWTGSKYKRGYGRFITKYISGTNQYAHRTAYILTYGIPDPSLDICHSCNNPSCCNPSHLYAGTAKQNIKDREDRYARGELIRKPGGRKAQKDGAQ